MANFVLIAGTFHGGWYWDSLADQLRALGHQVFAPTLSGLESQNRFAGQVNLDTHINDVLRLIDENQLEDVILVGWSYGGMVITGVADQTKAKVQSLIYLDGQLPKPGQREWDLIPDPEHESWISQCFDGLFIEPYESMLLHDARMVPHPLATKLQPLNYDSARFDALNKVYIWAEKWFHDPAVPSVMKAHLDRANAEPGWATESWPNGHDLLREDPERVLQLLIDQAAL